jgi:acetolactate decarboxylase
MRQLSRIVLAFSLSGTLVGCTESPTSAPAGNDTITQISIINALMIGRYDGVVPIPELLRHGDFGVGTLDHLDGELIVLDGHAFQVRGDGSVKEVGGERSTPFAIVTRFQADGSFRCPEVANLTAHDDRLDVALAQRNDFVAIRVDGRFSSITLRSVHRQEPPYRPLSEVARGQSVWTHANLTGTLVGIRCPAWIVGLNVPGYHWHFLSTDRTIGGHVLDCEIHDAEVHHDLCREWVVKLDDSRDYNRADFTPDLSNALKRVESSRPAPSEPTR